MLDEDVDRHTSELKDSREAAEEEMHALRKKGWDVYQERVPLSGQAGYYCVRTVTGPDGSEVRYAHSVRWNRFHAPLFPATIDCLDRLTLLSFVWRHAQHPGFEYFEYGDGDIGLVCYCNAEHGWSDVLRVSDEFDHDLDDTCHEILGEIASYDYEDV
jgi:hypothetical protein